MVAQERKDILINRRDLGALALGGAALLATPAAAQSILDRVWDDIKGDLRNLREDVREEAAYVLGCLATCTAIRWS